MRRKHGTILTGAAVIAATIVLTSAQTVNAGAGACCLPEEPYTCNSQKCGSCPYATCDPSAPCAGYTRGCQPLWGGPGDCITTDAACADVLCGGISCVMLPLREENTSEGDIASWPDEGLDKEMDDAPSGMPLWILGLPKLLL